MTTATASEILLESIKSYRHKGKPVKLDFGFPNRGLSVVATVTIAKGTAQTFEMPHPDGIQTWIHFQSDVRIHVKESNIPEIPTGIINGEASHSCQEWHIDADGMTIHGLIKTLANRVLYRMVG